jgi:hypothetical protein
MFHCVASRLAALHPAIAAGNRITRSPPVRRRRPTGIWRLRWSPIRRPKLVHHRIRDARKRSAFCRCRTDLYCRSPQSMFPLRATFHPCDRQVMVRFSLARREPASKPASPNTTAAPNRIKCPLPQGHSRNSNSDTTQERGSLTFRFSTFSIFSSTNGVASLHLTPTTPRIGGSNGH